MGSAVSKSLVLISVLCLPLAVGCGDNLHGSHGDGGLPGADAGPGGVDGSPDGGATGCGDGTVEAPEQCDDGNVVPGDGCEADCTLTDAEEVTCTTLTPQADGVCTVTAGGATLLLEGDVLTPGRIYRGGQVAVDEGGNITCVGCNCADSVPGATVVTCPEGAISPGLINTHDHLTFTQNSPAPDTGERYEQRNDWRRGLRGHTEINVPGGASSDEMHWGELRQLMGGTTSLMGAGAADGLVRNLDRDGDQQGLGLPEIDDSTFPLGDSSGTQLSGNCNYGSGADTADDIAGDSSYVAHVAEGIDKVARNEFLCTSEAAYDTMPPGLSNDLTQPQSAFIHGVGLEPADFQLMANDGTALIWSPRSNISLYGNTAEVTVAARAGVRIALGTDWTASGSINLLRELRCADGYNSTYLGGYFNDQELWRMVTVDAARTLHADSKIGTLAAGQVADIAIYDESNNDAYRAVVAADPADVALVMRGGKPLYGEDTVISALTDGTCDSLDVCGSTRSVCLQSDIGMSLADLQGAVGSTYDAFFCGTPTGEPTCVPSRPQAVNGSTVYTGQVNPGTDSDGDGIPDASDDCPTVFNPVRPVDDGAQADLDGDGMGDACDACPSAAGDGGCPPFDPADVDDDGVADSSDVCPFNYDPSQTDGDSDGHGDLCDACPADANPGAAGCPTTIYDIKDGTVPLGANVALSGALVTGREGSGFFLQVKETDAGYAGPEYSGIFVFAPGNTVAVGDRVDVTSAISTNYFDEIELEYAQVTGVSSGDSPPAPIAVTPADVTTGGASAAALEGVIVSVSDVTVSDVAPTPGPGDSAPTGEFAVDSGLRIDDLLYLITPFPVLNQSFASVTGILAFRNNNSKIEPRAAGDYVAGAAQLGSFAPTPSFIRVGDSGAPTIPEPLTVSLVAPSATDTVVTITSSDPTALTVVGGGVTVPAGQTSVPVLVNGLNPSPDVTLTATLDSTSLDAHVRVVAPAEQPAVVSVTPDPAQVTPAGSVTLTVTLDIPPTADTAVDLSVAPVGAGSVPAQVTVSANQTEATFDYTDAGNDIDGVVTASLGASSATATVNVQTGPTHLVINEVDYDQIDSDAAEFVEIYNPTASDVDLTNLSLVLVNGNGSSEYAPRIDLGAAGPLPAGGYLVIADSGATVDPGAIRIDFAAASNNIQNGPPDGLALIDTSALTVVDALSYEGEITDASINGFPGPISLVEGTPLSGDQADSNTVDGSLSRLPSGSDTDDADTDWAFTTTPTPGAANLP